MHCHQVRVRKIGNTVIPDIHPSEWSFSCNQLRNQPQHRETRCTEYAYKKRKLKLKSHPVGINEFLK